MAVLPPLAERMRPQALTDFIGQEHLLGTGKPLGEAIRAGQLHSMILWGPPGTGKTTLARLLAASSDLHFIALSAVLGGVKDIRGAVEQAKVLAAKGRGTLLFIDEVHRFNKAQQDAFLPHVEDGTLLFVGATTENPSFELNNALLSRARVYVLKALGETSLKCMLQQALVDTERGLATAGLELSDKQLSQLVQAADGDGRRALGLLELLAQLAADAGPVGDELVAEVLAGTQRRFDKGGDQFYDQISALHKSVRGSSPDGALYWYCRMLDGGCDPLYIARRVVRMASEDIGNADPRGLRIALDAWDVQQRLGSPEGELAIAQAILYLSAAAKSNAVYNAYNQARAAVSVQPSYEVPVHLRNAPTQLMKELGHGHEYRYAHDEPDAYAAGERYLPDDMPAANYYQPVPRGLEIKIADKLARLRGLDRQSRGLHPQNQQAKPQGKT